jgi:hypothetical protein
MVERTYRKLQELAQFLYGLLLGCLLGLALML